MRKRGSLMKPKGINTRAFGTYLRSSPSNSASFEFGSSKSTFSFPFQLLHHLYTTPVLLSLDNISDQPSTMSNQQSKIPDASVVPAVEVEGHMNALFELPSNLTGDDAPATCSQQNPLYRVGTVPRMQFNKRNEMFVQVKFKIHAEKEVEVQATSMKVASRSRRAAASAARYNLIESKMFNQGNVIELVKCLFGKSLKDFKGMCGDICDEYQSGMRQLVLASDLAPRLVWVAQVGREKITLVDHLTWQNFVDLLARATKHKGSVMIFTEDPKEKAKKDAQTSAAKELIASASGPTAAEAQVGVLTQELEVRDPHSLFSIPAFGCDAFDMSSDIACGTRMPQSGMATREIPPRTYEFLAIMKKARVFHKGTKVDDRVKMRSAQLRLDLSPTFHKSGGSRQSFFDPPAKLLFQKPTGSKRSASYAGLSLASEDEKKKVKIEPSSPPGLPNSIHLSSDPPSATGFPWSQECKIQIKKEPGSPSKRLTIVISSDPPSPSLFESSQEIQKDIPKDTGYEIFRSNTPGTSEDPHRAHAEALERFLVHCNVPPNDETTRMILERANVKSWTDLIPSHQFTESSLTTRGMHPALASHLVNEAMDRVKELNKDIDELEEQESVESNESTPRPPSPEF
ncbi:uncharacterized protein MELLADRAFT_79854 [Melampsora larici-populina 98AG31]|uniref:Uncharacterized protein n=1 Tax=Melampsora larici-populina (strain 98AG31 / pathotype 3-4-7) TaxID=747676 RepID=F4SE15_MELLP|nr:uncharacterized protein MELLADRAFT_79854 [Melampsora larici-populina 98AG31]EGF97112.1 hypothetical protein MELLADRAFT_79854 [Melampsora larici-populina 98AG31]